MGNNTNVENEYGADQIQVLEGLEAVRKRLFYYLYYLWLVHSQPARKSLL